MSDFVPRYSKPEKGNKFFNTLSNGGWSTAIKGKPTDSDCNVLHNCVGYAFGRFNEIAFSILGADGVKSLFKENGGSLKNLNSNANMPLLQPLNAENFYDIAKTQGLEITQTPTVGSCMVWQKGAMRQSGDGAGHVAIVEAVLSPTCVRTSESGYNANNAFWNQTRYKSTGNWGQNSNYKFLGFIVNPALASSKDPHPIPTRAVKEGDHGDDVKWVQWKLKSAEYLSDAVDGWFGLHTLGAVLAFQLKNNISVDGVVGPATRALLEKI